MSAQRFIYALADTCSQRGAELLPALLVAHQIEHGIKVVIRLLLQLFDFHRDFVKKTTGHVIFQLKAGCGAPARQDDLRR